MNPLDKPIEEFEWRIRTVHCLRNANIRTLRELVEKTETELLRSKHLGRKSLNEVKEVLARLGLRLGMRDDDDDNLIGVRR